MSLREHEPMLAALASGAERRNRPTAVVVFGCALLVGALAYTLWSATQVSGARALHRREAAAAAKVDALATQVQLLREPDSKADELTTLYQPSSALLSTLAQTATQAGLSRAPTFTQNTEDTGDPHLTKKIVVGRINGEELPKVLAWIERALRETPGLHVTQFSLKPTRAAGWEVEARFARWELKETPTR